MRLCLLFLSENWNPQILPRTDVTICGTTMVSENNNISLHLQVKYFDSDANTVIAPLDFEFRLFETDLETLSSYFGTGIFDTENKIGIEYQYLEVK